MKAYLFNGRTEFSFSTHHHVNIGILYEFNIGQIVFLLIPLSAYLSFSPDEGILPNGIRWNGSWPKILKLLKFFKFSGNGSGFAYYTVFASLLAFYAIET